MKINDFTNQKGEYKYQLVIGIVYIKKKLFYMNPILTLLSYNIYECTGRDVNTKNEFDGSYIFMAKNMNLKVGSVIKYKNIK